MERPTEKLARREYQVLLKDVKEPSTIAGILVLQSCVLWSYFKDDDVQKPPMPLKDVTEKALKHIQQCICTRAHCEPEELKKFLKNKTLDDLLHLSVAAHELQLNALLEITCPVIAELLEGLNTSRVSRTLRAGEIMKNYRDFKANNNWVKNEDFYVSREEWNRVEIEEDEKDKNTSMVKASSSTENGDVTNEEGS